MDTNGGFWSSLLSGDLISAKNMIFAMTAAGIKHDWIGQRIVEAVLIAVLSSGATGLMAYFTIIPRLDERVMALQRDVEQRAITTARDTARDQRRVDRIEERLDTHELRLAEELGLIREVLGRLGMRDGRPVTPRPSYRREQ